MEEKKFKVDDWVVVLNPEAFAKIIVRKPTGGYRSKPGHFGYVLRVNEEEGTMQLAIKKPTKAERWWYLVVKITTYVDDDCVFSHRPLGLVTPLPPGRAMFQGYELPGRVTSFFGTEGEIPHLTKKEKKYLDRVWFDF